MSDAEDFYSDLTALGRDLSRLERELGKVSVELAHLCREVSDLRAGLRPRPLEGEAVFVIVDEAVN